MAARASIAERRLRFRRLHENGCFVMPNPWDVGSARFLQGLGFEALATTSAGFAWTQGCADGSVTLAMVRAHLRAMVEATDLPINADFESGYAADATGVEANVRVAVETGVAGLSIEDATGDASAPLYPVETAVARIQAARHAIDQTDPATVLVARTECFIVGVPDLSQAIERLRCYASAGADCLYAPGLRTTEQVAAVVAAVAPKPVNVLVSSANGWTVAELAALGVRRISVGGALARVAWGAFARAARVIAQQGSFDGLAQALSGQELNQGFRAEHAPGPAADPRGVRL
jgi:2-methylisocitrate lyase-like PEP mutase family enzyme